MPSRLEIAFRSWHSAYLASVYNRLRALSNVFGHWSAVVVRRRTKLDHHSARHARRRGWRVWRALTIGRRSDRGLRADATALRNLHALLRSMRSWREWMAAHRAAVRLQATHRRKIAAGRVREQRGRPVRGRRRRGEELEGAVAAGRAAVHARLQRALAHGHHLVVARVLLAAVAVVRAGREREVGGLQEPLLGLAEAAGLR